MVHCKRSASVTVVKAKITATVTVILSRLRSATVDPAADEPMEPNISDRPPPLPLCNKIKKPNVSDTIT